jgi:hypothetical protein
LETPLLDGVPIASQSKEETGIDAEIQSETSIFRPLWMTFTVPMQTHAQNVGNVFDVIPLTRVTAISFLGIRGCSERTIEPDFTSLDYERFGEASGLTSAESRDSIGFDDLESVDAPLRASRSLFRWQENNVRESVLEVGVFTPQTARRDSEIIDEHWSPTETLCGSRLPERIRVVAVKPEGAHVALTASGPGAGYTRRGASRSKVMEDF